MSKIKVTVNNLSQLNEIIEYWNGKDVELSIEVKKNTATENSDVKCYGTSDKPMTKCEWENHKITSVSTSNKNQKR